MPLSDSRLAQRATEGDQRAFEAIYKRYHQDLYRFCLAMVGNPEDAQDALQNTMVKVLGALPGEERQIRLKPWLYRIARNEAVETLRRKHDSVELEPGLVSSGWEISKAAEDRERLRRLLADLEELPPRQRAALVMRELAGLDFAQIGEAFDSSPAVARQTLYEARLSLRQMEEGREMHCDEVMRALSDADGRVTRRREIRAHLRSCVDCRAFRDAISKRRDELAAIAPLPLAASVGLLHGVLGTQANGAAAAGAGATTGAAAGKAVATSVIVKSSATVAVVAALGVSAADRSGLIDLPLHSKSDIPSVQSAPQRSFGASGSGGRGSSAPPEPKGKSASKVRTGNDGPRASGNDGSPAPSNASGDRASSRSQAGLSPPGGGYGRSASERHGRPDQLPAASNHGQQTAAGHKSAHAAQPHGHGPSGHARGKSPGGGDPPSPKPTPSSKAKAPTTTPDPAQPSVEAPSRGKGKSPEETPGGAPSEPED